MVRILMVSGRAAARDLWRCAIESAGWMLLKAGDPGEAARIVQSDVVDVIVVDGPGADGEARQELIRAFSAAQPDAPVIVVWYESSSEARAEALRDGAFQILHEPVGPNELVHTIGRALELRELVQSHRALRQQVLLETEPGGLVGRSSGIRKVRELVAACTEGRSPVLIEGERGTGKELIARTLHYNSPRRELPFVPVRCQLSDEALAVELFGGSRNPAVHAEGPKRGAIEEAGGGTIYLEEIGHLSVPLQAKLLGAIKRSEEGIPSRGAPMPISARVIASSAFSIAELVQRGLFCEELYDILCITEITVPPLRDRTEDIAGLAQHFLARLEPREGERVTLSREALMMLETHNWPENVEELRTALTTAARLCTTHVLRPEDFPPEVQAASRRESRPDELYAGLPTLEDMNRRYLSHVIRAAQGDRAEAAVILGISQEKIYRMVKRSGP